MYLVKNTQRDSVAAANAISGILPAECCHRRIRRVFFTRYMASSARCSKPFLGSRIHGVGCHAHTGRQLDVQALVHKPGALAKPVCASAAATFNALSFDVLRQQDHKFISAVTERKIDQPATLLQRISNFRQQPRTHQVPVRIVPLV